MTFKNPTKSIQEIKASKIEINGVYILYVSVVESNKLE